MRNEEFYSFRMLVLFLLCISPLFFNFDAVADEEDDLRAAREEGLRFDPRNTGLLNQRGFYDESGDDISFTPYYPPAEQADTRNIKRWGVFIERVDVDPPNAVILYIRDDSPFHYQSATVSVKVAVAQADRMGYSIIANQTAREDIPIEKGITRIPVNILVHKGDLVRANLTGVRLHTPYKTVDTLGE